MSPNASRRIAIAIAVVVAFAMVASLVAVAAGF